MTLQLNGIIERLSNLHQDFPGQVTEQMPILVSGKDEEGKLVDVSRIPASLAYIIEKRETAPSYVVKAWRRNSVFTGDAVVYGVNGDVVSVLDSSLLQSLTPRSELINGALVLSDEQWRELKAQKEGTLYLTADEVIEAHEKGYILQKGIWVPQNKTVGKVWDHLARGRDLQSYAQLVSEDGRNINGDARSNILDLCFDDREGYSSAILRSWVVNSIRGGSDAFGNFRLNGTCERLFGIASKAYEKILQAKKEAV